MNLLDSFFILFEADASKLNKGLDESDKRARKTTDEVKKLDDAAYKMGERLGNSIKTLGGALVGFIAARSLMASFNASVMEADKMDESAKALGVATEELSAYSDAVKEAGGTTEGFQGSLRALNQSLAMAATTGKSRATPFLKEMGIDLDNVKNKGKTAFDFLPQIADAFATMGKQESLAMGQKIGFDVGTIMMLQGGKRELEALIQKHKELGSITTKQGEIAAKFNDQLDDARHALRSVWLGIAEAVLPVVTSIVGGFTTVIQFVRRHSDFFIGFFGAIATVITAVLLPSLYRMAAAVVIAFAPFFVVGAVIAGLATLFALLYDDVMAFLAGQDSLLGKMLERWPVLGRIFQGLADIVRAVAAAVLDAFNTMGTGIAAVWGDLTAKVRAFFDFVKAGAALVKGIAGALVGAFTGGGRPGATSPQVMQGVAAGQSALGLAGSSPISSQTSNSISNTRGGNRSTTVQVGKVEVQTQATDAAGISKAIGGTMQTQLSQAVDNFDDGVAA
jgi:tetrahydromethanopterin S-methyltransferase subunit G